MSETVGTSLLTTIFIPPHLHPEFKLLHRPANPSAHSRTTKRQGREDITSQDMTSSDTIARVQTRQDETIKNAGIK